jgi:predicted aldo/keto reductase-like oxidoreductase
MEKRRYESPRAILALVDELLKELNVERMDIFNVHIAGYDFLPDYLGETKQRLIEAGKIRFLTSSYHDLMPPGNAESTLKKFARVYDGFLGGFNFLRGRRFPGAAFAEYGLGAIAFKPMQGLGWTDELLDRAQKEGINPQEAAVRWLLNIPEITSVVRRNVNFSQLESNLKAIAFELTEEEERFLGAAALSMADSTCDLCGRCTRACPNGVSVTDIQRTRLYAVGFRDEDRARELYSSLGSRSSYEACRDCGSCERACLKHLPIRQTMAATHQLFFS